MSIEIFSTLQASVTSQTVTLTWTKNFPGFPPVTAFAVQRKLFGRGDDSWSTLSSGISSTGTSFSYTDAVGAVGDWSYRVVATVTQGGVDAAGTSLFSNQVNVTTEATTGEVTLAVGSRASTGLTGYTEVDLAWNIAGTAVDVKLYTVWRALGSGPARPIAHIDEFEQSGVVNWNENIPNGSGVINYYVVAHLPSAAPPYQASILSQSNTASVTI